MHKGKYIRFTACVTIKKWYLNVHTLEAEKDIAIISR